jgi:hypothetical protein
MRTLASVVVLAAAPAFADGAEVVELEVGATKVVVGFRALCDDPAVASIADGKLLALKVGETACSLSSGSPLGPRTIYRVIVRPASGKGGGEGKGPGASKG